MKPRRETAREKLEKLAAIFSPRPPEKPGATPKRKPATPKK